MVDPAKPWSYPDIFPQSLSFERWKIVWETTSLPEAMFNSYTIAPTVSLITILLSLPTAYAFGRMEFRGKKLAELLTLIHCYWACCTHFTLCYSDFIRGLFFCTARPY